MFFNGPHESQSVERDDFLNVPLQFPVTNPKYPFRLSVPVLFRIAVSRLQVHPVQEFAVSVIADSHSVTMKEKTRTKTGMTAV